jgi:hypothetical protein
MSTPSANDSFANLADDSHRHRHQRARRYQGRIVTASGYHIRDTQNEIDAKFFAFA